MPRSYDPDAPEMTLAEIAEHWLGINYLNLQQRLRRAEALNLPPPQPTRIARSRGTGKLYPNSLQHRDAWLHWNRQYTQVQKAVAVFPRMGDYKPAVLWRYRRSGKLTHWMQDLASVITELIRLGDTAARFLHVPEAEPTGRLKAINPDVAEGYPAYIRNLGRWARVYAQRLRAADAVIRARDPQGVADWEAELVTHLGADWLAVLNRCSSWR